MALLNFSQTYENIKNKVGTAGYLQSTDLLFTKDGHIVTHGVDYIPWGNGIIPIEKLPIATGDTHNENTLWTSETIFNKINNSFLANEAMRFKGSISIQDSTGAQGKVYLINGDATPDGKLPKGEVGDTYRVSTKGSYGSNICEVGDLLICYESGATKEEDKWTVVQTNINGYSKFTVNEKPYYLYTTDSTDTFEIYAPTVRGEEGQILLWNDNQAVWADRSALNIGQYLKAGNGLQIGTDNTGYNGSYEKTISLLQATTSSIGGVIIDQDDLPLNGKPTKITDNRAHLNGATISIDATTGVIYLTQQNIINALGYAPEGQGAVSETWRPIKINNVDFLDSSTTGATLNMGSGNSTIVITPSTDNTGNVSFDVNLGYDRTQDTSTSGSKRVAVEAGTGTNLGKLYVEIPEYDVVSNEINGLAPKIINTETSQIDPNYYILASPKGSKSASWYQLDISAINTWRPISIADQNLENRSLKIVETDNVVFTWDADEFNNGEAATFGIELQWKEWKE